MTHAYGCIPRGDRDTPDQLTAGPPARPAPPLPRTTNTWDIENMCAHIALPNGTLNTFAYDADLVRRQVE